MENYKPQKFWAKYSLNTNWLIIKENHLNWIDFYVLQTFQQINQLLKQQNAVKVGSVEIIL